MPTSACICVHCGRSFQCERALQKHMACHDDRKLKCEQCSKEFSGIKALKNHERSHKSSECVYCLKTLPKNTNYSHQLTCSERRDSTNLNVINVPMKVHMNIRGVSLYFSILKKLYWEICFCPAGVSICFIESLVTIHLKLAKKILSSVGSSKLLQILSCLK